MCVCMRRKEWVCVHEEEGVGVCVHACVILREK